MENGDFVEFKARLRKNPLLDTIEEIKKLTEIASLLTPSDKNLTEKTPQKGSRPKNQNQVIIQQLDGILKALSQPNSIELVGELVSNPEIKVVLTTKSDFFTPGGEAEIIDGEFLILGKVIRVIRSDESINLLRKTTFGRFKEDILNKLVSGFEGLKMQDTEFQS